MRGQRRQLPQRGPAVHSTWEQADLEQEACLPFPKKNGMRMVLRSQVCRGPGGLEGVKGDSTLSDHGWGERSSC